MGQRMPPIPPPPPPKKKKTSSILYSRVRLIAHHLQLNSRSAAVIASDKSNLLRKVHFLLKKGFQVMTFFYSCGGGMEMENNLRLFVKSRMELKLNNSSVHSQFGRSELYLRT